MSQINDSHLKRLRKAMSHESPDTPLGKAVARLREPFDLGDGDHYRYESFVEMFMAIRIALHEIDPSISRELPAFLLDPSFIAKFFRIPLDRLNYQGTKQSESDSTIVPMFQQIMRYLETNLPKPRYQPDELNPTEKKLLRVLGNDKLTGEKLAERAKYPYNSNLKQTLSSLVKRGLLGNEHRRGYYRLGEVQDRGDD